MATKVAQIRARAHGAVNYRLRTFAGGRLASHCRPTEIAVLLTERCNARCLHCDIWKNRGKESTPGVDSLENHDAGPQTLARAGPRGLHRRRGTPDAIRAGGGDLRLLARPPGRAFDPRILAGPEPRREDGHGPALAGDDLVRRNRRDPRQDPRPRWLLRGDRPLRSRRSSDCAGSTNWATRSA